MALRGSYEMNFTITGRGFRGVPADSDDVRPMRWPDFCYIHGNVQLVCQIEFVVTFSFGSIFSLRLKVLVTRSWPLPLLAPGN